MHAKCILTFREKKIEASENSIVALKKLENHRDLGRASKADRFRWYRRQMLRFFLSGSPLQGIIIRVG